MYPEGSCRIGYDSSVAPNPNYMYLGTFVARGKLREDKVRAADSSQRPAPHQKCGAPRRNVAEHFDPPTYSHIWLPGRGKQSGIKKQEGLTAIQRDLRALTQGRGEKRQCGSENMRFYRVRPGPGFQCKVGSLVGCVYSWHRKTTGICPRSLSRSSLRAAALIERAG